MEVHKSAPFHNWGNTVEHTPLYTFVPTTVLGLSNLVKWAKVEGYRDKQVLVSMLNLESVERIPDVMSITKQKGDFRRWAVGHGKWALPVDVILVEVTAGGVNGPICHGAGRRHKTVSDYVRAIEYIDANGMHRTITKPAHLRAAAGCFGLLGIVTHITFLLSPMSYAILRPTKPDIALAIPRSPPPTFPSRSANPGPRPNTPTPSPILKTRPIMIITASGFGLRAWVQGWVGSVLTGSEIFGLLPGRWQACILSSYGMVALPPFEFSDFEQKKTIEYKTALPNGLHFRRGIQNMRVRDLEFQIPIPCLPDATPDYKPIRRAWWDIIQLCYRDSETPMRLTLELRIMADSDLILAPQRGTAGARRGGVGGDWGEQGWGLGELKERFSNELWDYLVFGGVGEGKGKGEDVEVDVDMGKKAAAKGTSISTPTAPSQHPNNQGKPIETNGVANASKNLKAKDASPPPQTTPTQHPNNQENPIEVNGIKANASVSVSANTKTKQQNQTPQSTINLQLKR
ncbi:hypothetical protein DID88_004144 [Monilinia fructigena]|uniref:FAD-binding PCMH-type domain-containing protein n=1 Tax=Monilinia fructigena TaxID=38457 RepID=A0A395IXJ5_9HELO|nr:hypothetical protein DID88_004144 [Monilinia fructigena]